MNEELLIFTLRIATSVALFAFVGTVGLLIWRDLHRAAETFSGFTRQRGRLIVMKVGENSIYDVGQSWPILPLTTIGRAPTNTIQLNEPIVSFEHAVVEWRGGQWWLEDLNSSNGTKLNDHRIDDPVVLSSQDEISFGSLQLRLELD